MHFPYALPFLLLGIYLKEIEDYVHTKTCAQILIALFVIAKAWK